MEIKVSNRIKVFSFFMTLIIIAHHTKMLLIAFTEKDNMLAQKVITTVGQWVGFAMMYFFFITGFLLFRNLTLKTLGSKIKRRVHSLLIPYLLWQLIAIVVFSLRGMSYTAEELIKTIFLFKKWPPNGPIWYVYIIFLLTFLSPLIMIFHKKKWSGMLLVFAGIALARMNTWESFLGDSYLNNTISFLPAYLLGAYWGRFYPEMKDVSDLKDATLLILIGIFLQGVIPDILNSVVLMIMPVMIMHFLPVDNWLENPNVAVLCDSTFFLYANATILYPFIALGAYRIFIYLFYDTWLQDIFGKLSVILMNIVISVLLCEILKRVMPKLLIILTGGRSHPECR